MAELLYRGFDAYMADRANPAYDVVCVYNPTTRMSLLRVKTCTNHTAVWNSKKTGDIFLNLKSSDDYVVIVNLGDGLRERSIYIVPTHVMDLYLRTDFDHYVSCIGRGGIKRSADSSMRRIHFAGEDRPDNTGYDYAKKLSDYLEAWDQLK